MTRAKNGSFLEIFADFGGDLGVGHFVGGFYGNDSVAQIFCFKMFFQFAFSLARAEYQNRFCIADSADYMIVVGVEMAEEFPVVAVAFGSQPRFEWAFVRARLGFCPVFRRLS